MSPVSLAATPSPNSSSVYLDPTFPSRWGAEAVYPMFGQLRREPELSDWLQQGHLKDAG